VCVSPFEKKGRILAAWPWPLRRPAAAAARCHSCKTVVRESEGASLLPLLGFLILYKIGCNHRRYHQSPSKQAMGMWKLGTKSHHLLSPTPRCSSRLGEAGGAGEGLISSPSWPVAPLLSCLAIWFWPADCAPYPESLRAPDFLFHPLGLLPSWKHR